MSTDVLNLGGFLFTGYSTPDVMMGGGRQAMVVHKLPGGTRVIDTLGPDEAEISWRGHFFENAAYAKCLQLDAMRAAGAVLTLSWGGTERSVLIADFVYRVRRLPVWVEYSITCTVVVNPSLGNVGAFVATADSMVTSDLANADSVVSSNATANVPLEQSGGP